MKRRTLIAGAAGGVIGAAALIAGAESDSLAQGGGFADLSGDSVSGDLNTISTSNVPGVDSVLLTTRSGTPGLELSLSSPPPDAVALFYPNGDRHSDMQPSGTSAWMPLSYPIRRTGDWTLRGTQSGTTDSDVLGLGVNFDVQNPSYDGSSVSFDVVHTGSAPVNIGSVKLSSRGEIDEEHRTDLGPDGRHWTGGGSVSVTLPWESQPEQLLVNIYRHPDTADAADAGLTNSWSDQISV